MDRKQKYEWGMINVPDREEMEYVAFINLGVKEAL